jgi:hypothetical protein
MWRVRVPRWWLQGCDAIWRTLISPLSGASSFLWNVNASLSDSPASLLRIPCFLFVYCIDESDWCQKLKQRIILQEKSIKVKFMLEQAAKTQRGSRGIAVLFNLVARWGWVVSATPRPLYPQESPGTHCTCIAGWVGPVWTGAENLAPPVFDPRTIQLVASR